MPIVPTGSATAKQSKAKAPGAGQPAQAGDRTIFEGGQLESEEGAADEGEGDETPSESDQNKDNKSQRKGQAGWQQITETLGKINERLDKFEQGKAPAEEKGEEGEKGKAAAKQENEAMNALASTLAATNARLERMEFEGAAENSDLRSPDVAPLWKKVNSDPKFKDFSMADRADYVRGKSGKSRSDTMKDQLSRAEGSMPRGSGGGKSAKGGNPNVTEEDVAVGQAFGISREELEAELS